MSGKVYMIKRLLSWMQRDQLQEKTSLRYSLKNYLFFFKETSSVAYLLGFFCSDLSVIAIDFLLLFLMLICFMVVPHMFALYIKWSNSIKKIHLLQVIEIEEISSGSEVSYCIITIKFEYCIAIIEKWYAFLLVSYNEIWWFFLIGTKRWKWWRLGSVMYVVCCWIQGA